MLALLAPRLLAPERTLTECVIKQQDQLGAAHMKIEMSIIALVFLGGCAMPGPTYFHRSIPFQESAFAPYSGGGNANIHGQAFLRTVGGDVRTCAGSHVQLIPATPYVVEIISAIHAGRSDVQSAMGPVIPYQRETVCDAQGNFGFENIPSGTWYVWTTVEWGVPGRYSIESQGGNLIKMVIAQHGENKIVLTGEDGI